MTVDRREIGSVLRILVAPAIVLLLIVAASAMEHESDERRVGSREWCYERAIRDGMVDERCPSLRLDHGLAPADWRQVR